MALLERVRVFEGRYKGLGQSCEADVAACSDFQCGRDIICGEGGQIWVREGCVRRCQQSLLHHVGYNIAGLWW